MIDDFLPLGIDRPGFFANGTTYQAKGRWRGGNFIRFHEGTIQPIGGWAQQSRTGAAIIGTPIAALCWQFEDGTPYVALGTTQGLYIIDENNVVYDITPASIAAPEYDWQLTNFGAYLIATNSILGDADLSVMNIYKWVGNTAAPADAAWAGTIGPMGGYSCFATPERQIVVLRGTDPTTRPARSGVDTAYSERRVYFGTTEELDGFVSSDTNEGGDFDLQTPGRLVVGTQGKGQSLIWSDVDLWTMTFIGGQLVYSFAKVGDDCGIVSKRAFAQIDKGAYWMGRGKFFIYDGFTRSIPCEVTDAVFKNFNEQRAHTVWAVSLARFNEITWYYPSAGSQYPDSYVTYNHVENHWVFGKIDRTAGVQKRFNADVIDETKPLFFNGAGAMFQHETGNERDSLAFLESGPIEVANGDRLMRLQGILDDEDVAGNVQLRIYTAMAADSLETLQGPFTLGPVTNLRLKARQIRLRIEEVSATSWRVGNPRLSVRPVERRGIGPGAIDEVPASLEIIPNSITLINAQHYTFQSIVKNAAGQVLDILPDVWTSDNTNVPVDDNGTVTALATPQTAHIQAFITSPALSSNIATVTVEGSTIPFSITITPTAEALIAASTPVTLTAVVKNNLGQILVNQAIAEWDTTDATKVTVTMGGGLGTTATAEGVAFGSANLTAKITSPAVVTSNISVATVTDPFVVHTFLATAQFHVSTIGTGVVNRVLVVGGGGSGASVDGTGVGTGGGGAGAVIESDSVTVVSGDNPVTVGVGGAAVVATGVLGLTIEDGLGGAPSTFRSHTADGGGAGSAAGVGGSTDSASNPAGSGGGGRGDASGGDAGGGGGTGGHAGGGGSSSLGGGGGGAGSNGLAGAGGSPSTNDISGTSVSYGGGGNGGLIVSRTGFDFAAVAGSPGADGSGSGGDGSKGGYSETFDEGLAAQSGKGGDGVVIIRYRVSTGIVATGGIKVVHS